MPGFSVDISFPVGAVYNIKPSGGAELQGNAEVEVVRNETKKPESVNEGKIHESLLEYVKYAMNRVESS